MTGLLATPPAVSAIIPARNAAATLGEALDSLLAQTVTDWEAIIVDDGSSDDTAGVAMAYAARDGRLRLLRAEAGSAAAARNAGLALARGRHLLFLDADDWVAPTHLERLLGMLAAAPDATAAYCGFRRVAPDGRIGPATWRADIAAEPIQAFAHRPGTAIHAVLVDRAAVATLGGFNPALPVCEDWDLWQRLAFGGARFVGTPEPLAFYRMQAGSLSHRHRQLLHDGLVVLRRAAATLGDADAGWQLPATFLAIWCAAAEVGAGRDGVALLEESGLAIRPGDDFDALRETLLDGLAVGAAETLPGLAQDWQRVAAGLGALLDWLEGGGEPGLARKLTYAIEWRVLAACDLAAPLSLGLTMGARVDLRRPEGFAPPAGVDLALLRLCDGASVLRTVQLPLLGPVSARDIVALAIDELWLGTVWRRSGARWRPGVWARAAGAATGLALRAVAGRLAPRRVTRPAGGPRALAKMALAKAMVAAAGPTEGAGGHAGVFAAIRCAAEVEATGLPRAAAAAAEDPAQRGHAVAWNDADRHAYWEALFETADPWDYGSGYESEKYRRTLDLLPEAPLGEVLELACAEGHFTRLLAPRVGRLLATDIAERALARAAERCQGINNIAFQRLDLEAEPLPAGLDLIVCSEVLYYLPDEAALHAVATKIHDALAPGGHLLTAHAFVLGDDPARTGFDWDHDFGATTIARVFASTPGMVVDRVVETDLYRIARYRRDDSAGASLVEPEVLPLAAALASEVARQVVWGGAEARRRVLRHNEATESVPVLMYHRVAEDGPPGLAPFRVTPAQFEAQLRLLRRRGWHAISSAELRWFIAARQPVPGRPVLITFDDGTRDFLDLAWPILRANDFGAEVFVPTDLVGGDACWDAAYGTPAPLLGWEEIAALAREGVAFGSHLARHVDGLGLSTAALAGELARSRATLEARLGQEVRSFAAPYGSLDERFARLAADCGYHVGFSTRPGWAGLDDPPLMLPRIEVYGDWDLDTFGDAMKPAR
jgi:peptidoglycan/xylan/chitin deacetylase (PgdA/CDA1 family)/SAM-dependent methyltransferase